MNNPYEFRVPVRRLIRIRAQASLKVADLHAADFCPEYVDADAEHVDITYRGFAVLADHVATAGQLGTGSPADDDALRAAGAAVGMVAFETGERPTRFLSSSYLVGVGGDVEFSYDEAIDNIFAGGASPNLGIHDEVVALAVQVAAAHPVAPDLPVVD